jgi:hypothetical protein
VFLQYWKYVQKHTKKRHYKYNQQYIGEQHWKPIQNMEGNNICTQNKNRIKLLPIWPKTSRDLYTTYGTWTYIPNPEITWNNRIL